jgi:hypothetical protein
LNDVTAQIVKAVNAASPDHVSRPGAPAYGLEIDDGLKFRFLLDVDSLFFELNALCEIMGLLVAKIHDLAGEPVPQGAVGATLKRAIAAQGADTAWFAFLDHARNHFLHAAAPYVAADVTTASRPELLILKSNVSEITDETEFIRMSEITNMVRGFGRAVEAVEAHVGAFLGTEETLPRVAN